MRKLAEELGVGAGAVYWHVANKEQLVQLVFDRVIAELPMPEPEPKRWREQIKQAARDERDMMRRHPGIAQLSLGRIPIGPNAIRYMEWHLSILRSGGLTDRVASLAGDLIYLYIGAFSYEECLGVSVPGDKETSPHDFIGQVREYFASLPADRSRTSRRLAGQVTSGGGRRSLRVRARRPARRARVAVGAASADFPSARRSDPAMPTTRAE